MNLSLYISDQIIQDEIAEDAKSCYGKKKWKLADRLDKFKCEAPRSYLHVHTERPEGIDK